MPSFGQGLSFGREYECLACHHQTPSMYAVEHSALPDV
jgi:hypothetical protein